MTHSAPSTSQIQADKIKKDFIDKFFALGGDDSSSKLQAIQQDKTRFRNNASLVTPALKAKIDSINPDTLFEYCQQTHVNIGSKEFKLAKRFLAFVALTGGEVFNYTDSTSATKRTTHKSVYQEVGILDQDIKIPSDATSVEEKLNFIEKQITADNLKKFYQRILKKRPKMFFGTYDETHGEISNRNFNLAEFISYSEREVGALLNITGPVDYVGLAKRNQSTYQVSDPENSFQPKGFLTLMTGIRLELANPEFYHHMKIPQSGRDVLMGLTNGSDRNSENRIKLQFNSKTTEHQTAVEAYESVWRNIYQRTEAASNTLDDEAKRKLAIATYAPENSTKQEVENATKILNIDFDEETSLVRYVEEYRKLILDAIDRSSTTDKKAFLRIRAIGDGAWQGLRDFGGLVLISYANKIQTLCGKAVAKVIKSLDQDQLNKIGGLEFSSFGNSEIFAGFESELKIENVVASTTLEQNGKNIKIKGANQSSADIPIINFKYGNNGANTKLHDNFQNCDVYSICPWDSGCLGIGNEFHQYTFINTDADNTLTASDDPVIACSAPIALATTNPYINPFLEQNIFVINEQGKKVTIEQHFAKEKVKESLSAGTFERTKARAGAGFVAGTEAGAGAGAITGAGASFVAETEAKAGDEAMTEDDDIKNKFATLQKNSQESFDAFLQSDSGPARGPIDGVNFQELKTKKHIISEQFFTAQLNPISDSQDQAPLGEGDTRIFQKHITSYKYKNIWDKTIRGNLFRFDQSLIKSMLTDFQKDNPDSKKLTDSQIAEKIQKISDNFFIGQLFTAFDQVNLNNTSPMTINDLFLALKIAKEFGGLSNFLNVDKSGYQKSNLKNPPEDIKKYFSGLDDTEISNKLKLYQKFSAEFQRLNQGLVYSMRTTANQTPLRLTFFPDSAIERLKGYNEENKNHAINFAKKTKTERGQVR